MFGGKEGHRVCHVLRLSGVSLRDGLAHLGADGLRQGGGHIRSDEAGGHRIDGDVPAGQLFGEALGQADQARLAGGIVGLARVAPQAHHAAQVDDAAIALAHHPACSLLAAEERTLEVGVQDGVKVFLGKAEDEVVAGDARVVDQNVHPSEGVHRLFKQLLAALGGGDVGLHGDSIHALLFAQGGRLGGSGLAVAVVDHHIAALLCQREADGPADAPASAGDDGGTGQLFFAHACASFQPVRKASSSSAVSTAVQRTSVPSVFFTKPLRALPGPTSRMSVTPSSPRRRRVSSM